MYAWILTLSVTVALFGNALHFQDVSFLIKLYLYPQSKEGVRIYLANTPGVYFATEARRANK